MFAKFHFEGPGLASRLLMLTSQALLSFLQAETTRTQIHICLPAFKGLATFFAIAVSPRKSLLSHLSYPRLGSHHRILG